MMITIIILNAPKMNQLRTSLLSLMLGFSLLTGCSSNPSNSTNQTETPDTTETLNVTVSILPQKYFVKKIGGTLVDVNVMVEPGNEPHTYEPRPQQLKALSDAEAYIGIGISFENAWMEKIASANSNMVIIDSAKGVEKMEMIEHHHHSDEKDDDHEDSEETFDPHIWLSPQLVKLQAENIYQGLVKIDPENEAEYKANLAEFLGEIDQLDQQIRQNLAGIQNRKFIVFHPSWGYFAHDYNLVQIPIEVEGQEPSAAELGALVKEAKEENIRVIFAQYQFNSQDAQTIAREIKGEVVFIDPLAPNWSDNLLKVSETFAELLKPQSYDNFKLFFFAEIEDQWIKS